MKTGSMRPVRCIDPAFALLGEAPFWDAATQSLYWTDIFARRIHRMHPETGESRVWRMPDRITCVVPRAQGSLLVALSREIALFDPDSGALQTVFALDRADPRTRFNDSRTDANGRLWIGTMNEVDDAPCGMLLRIDADLTCTCVETDIRISNGINFSPAGDLFYFADSPERIIRAYDFDLASGELGARRDLVTLDAGDAVPDGSAVDNEGCIWNAQWDGGRIVRYAPDGSVREIVAMPVSRPTSCVFGGRDLATLFITSSCMDLSQPQMRAQFLAGALFALDAGVSGPACTRFAG